jgi:hypothetical protein
VLLSLGALALSVVPADARANEGFFFLLMAGEPPDQALVQAAYREAARTSPTLSPDEAKATIGRAFPRLFSGSRTVDRNAIDGDLKVARSAHFGGQFQESEDAFTRALNAVLLQPEMVTGQAALLQRLTDGAAIRFTNGLARKRPDAEVRGQLEAYLRKYPFTSPSASDHPPAVQKAWNDAREAAKAGSATLVVNVHPLELERSGTCRLHINGAEVAELPMPGALSLPSGEHFMQVRCGAQASWVQRLDLRGTPKTLRVPVRAMLGARGDAQSGGIVLVDPGERDSAVLVDAVAEATGLAGAVVARTATAKVEFGRWNAGMSGPTVENVGAIDGSEIVGVKRAQRPGPEASSGGKVWAWVAGGVGIAAVAGGVVANVMYEDERQSGKPQSELSGLQTASTALYIAGGALLATSIILFFVEGGSGDGAATSGFVGSPGAGQVLVRF